MDGPDSPVRRFGGVLTAVLVVVSCQTVTPPPSPSALPAASAAVPVRGGRVIFAVGGDIATLQPVITSDSGSQGVWSLIYERLLTTDPATGEPRPNLAERVDASADGRRITYTLREGLVWSDGVPVTGEDYRYHIEAVARSRKTTAKSGYADISGWLDYVEGRTDRIAGIRISGSGRVIEVDLARASCPSVYQLAVAPLPRHRFLNDWDNRTTDLSANIDASPMNDRPPVATGPFVFKERRAGDQIVLSRNDRYFKGSPLLDEVVFKVVGTNVRAALLTGEGDVGVVSPADVADTRNRSGGALREYRVAGLGYTFLGWNQHAARAPWLADRRVRRALWYGLDVQTIVDKVVLGFGQRVFAHTPASSWAYDDTGLEHYDYDPSRARALLEEAGARMGPDGMYRWTDGTPMRLRIESQSGLRGTIAEVVKEQYKVIGIAVDLVVEAFNTLIARLTPPDATVEGFIVGWSLDPDPDAYPIWHSSQIGKGGLNLAAFSDPRVDALLSAGRYGPDCSRAARRAAYASFDRILNEEAPYVFLFSTENTIFVTNRLVAPPPLPYATRYDIEKWWIRP